MKRRCACLSITLALPLAGRGRAQTPQRRPLIAFLSGTRPDAGTQRSVIGPFEQGLREQGLVAGQNLSLVYRWADGQPERLPALLTELVAMKPDVLVTSGPGPAMLARDAARAASWSLPVLAVAVDDPVQMGLAASITRPGGHITGLSGAFRGILPKRLQLMKDILPGARRMAILFNPATVTRETIANDMPQWQRTLDLILDLVPARGPQDFDAAFEAMASARAEAVAILADATFYAHRLRLGELCVRHRLPAVVGGRDYLGDGFVVSYQGDFAAMFRRAGSLVDKILKGTKPGEIPFEQSIKLELVVNQKAARALGLRIPASVLVSADEVIE